MLTIAFQGERGAYSEEAVVRHWGTGVEPVPCRTFSDVFAAVSGGETDLALVPAENSHAGSINETHDLLLAHDLHITGETVLRVRHCLLALPGQTISGIQRVYSHPQALAQCEEFIRRRNLDPIATHDTAGSARMVREEAIKDAGAIAGARAAEIYGLEVLAEGIQTVDDNCTRFLVLGRMPGSVRDGAQRTALVMATNHEPGALHGCLRILAGRGINLLKLESRPGRKRPWEYVFYLDLEGHRDDPAVAQSLQDLARATTFLRVLGSFPRCEDPEGRGC